MPHNISKPLKYRSITRAEENFIVLPVIQTPVAIGEWPTSGFLARWTAAPCRPLVFGDLRAFFCSGPRPEPFRLGSLAPVQRYSVRGGIKTTVLEIAMGCTRLVVFHWALEARVSSRHCQFAAFSSEAPVGYIAEQNFARLMGPIA